MWQVAWAHPMYGNILASCSYDRKVIIWKEENGTWEKTYEYTGHDSSGMWWSRWTQRVKLHLTEPFFIYSVVCKQCMCSLGTGEHHLFVSSPRAAHAGNSFPVLIRRDSFWNLNTINTQGVVLCSHKAPIWCKYMRTKDLIVIFFLVACYIS